MFRASAPVAGETFHDRARELASLISAFEALAAGAPRWVALLGPRKVGKTSLLIEAARRAPPGVDVAMVDVMGHVPLTLDIFRVAALAAIDALFAADAGGSLAQHAGQPAEFRARLLASPLHAKLEPVLKLALDRLLDEPATPAAVRTWLQLPEQLAKSVGRKLVMVIDEVQELASLRSRQLEPFPVMRAVWQRHDAVSYVISGSAPSVLRELVTSRDSPFFGHFQLLELGPFATRDALSLLEAAAPPGRSITAAVAERIVELVGGHPFYLQVVGEALVALEPPYVEATLKPVLQSLLFSRTGRLGLYFENEWQRLVGRAATAAATLQAVATGAPLRLSEIARQIASSAPSTARYLERLGDAVARRDDGRYVLSDPVFAMWVRWRSPGGTAVPMRVIGDEAEAAAAEHLGGLGFELVYQSRGSKGAFDLLAVRGAAQLALQCKRADLPLRFGKQAWNRMEADAKRWKWAWALAAVGEDGTVRILDPRKARRGRGVRLDESAVVDNVLLWLDKRR